MDRSLVTVKPSYLSDFRLSGIQFALFIAGRATNNRQIVQYFASLLRPNDGDDMSPSPSMPSTSYHNGFMPSPERSSSMGRDSVEDTTAGTESSRLNNLQPGPA